MYQASSFFSGRYTRRRMAYRGHWLHTILLEIDSIADTTAKYYWYALRDGLDGDGIDDEAMRENVLADSQPSRVQRMLRTLLNHRPEFSTPALEALIAEDIPEKEPERVARKELPKITDLALLLAESLETMASPRPTQKKKMAKDQNERVKAFMAWVVISLSMDGFALRVSELASVAIDDPEAENWLDTATDTLTLRRHKNKKSKGDRVYRIPGFSEQWAGHARQVFGRLPAFLIVNKGMTQMTPNALSLALQKMSTPLGSQTVRPMITTYTMSTTPKEELFDARRDLARKMGHGMPVQASKYYRGKYTA